ncbi:unnamed protein product [Closterium sp. NIES-53]
MEGTCPALAPAPTTPTRLQSGAAAESPAPPLSSPLASPAALETRPHPHPPTPPPQQPPVPPPDCPPPHSPPCALPRHVLPPPLSPHFSHSHHGRLPLLLQRPSQARLAGPPSEPCPEPGAQLQRARRPGIGGRR